MKLCVEPWPRHTILTTLTSPSRHAFRRIGLQQGKTILERGARMSLVIFGQPDDGIIQSAYVVKDIRESINHWVRDLKVGPWFLIEHFQGEDAKYRGGPSNADSALAMSFAGHMMIELIQQYNDAPSVYRETIDKRGYGFHHWGVATSNFDRDVERYRAQ